MLSENLKLLLRPVVFKRVPLDSLSEEFFILGRNGNSFKGGKAVDEKNFDFYYLFIQHINYKKRLV